MEEYPNHCIRGILNSTYFSGDGELNPGAFDFKTNKRTDDWKEASINWKDAEDAVDFTFKQTKMSGEPKFKAGIAILPRSSLEQIKKRTRYIGNFDYERAEEEGNIYHGNLLINKNISNTKRDIIRSLLIFAAETFKREDYYIPEQQSLKMKDTSKKNPPQPALFRLITYLKRTLTDFLKS